MENKKYCVIMAGGIGSRFWPISRTSRPKQFLDILGTGKTFLRATFERFLPIIPKEDFLVVTNAVYKDLVMEQLPEIGEHQVLCEPIGRNTAPCIAYAALRINAVDPGADMIVTPSDHLILNEDEFRKSIVRSVEFIQERDAMMTIGIKPTDPNTGYGYIQVEKDNIEGRGAVPEIHKVKTFTEKPGLELARTFVESGEFFWNSGIFIWKVGTILQAMSAHLSDMYQLFNSILPHYNTPREKEHIARIYPECRAVSIDIGIMEKARNAYVYCSDFGWSDVGTWGSLYQHSPKDGNGNVISGYAALYDTANCIVKVPEGKLVVVDGLQDYIVVESDNVLMICPRSGEQNIKRYVEEAKFKKGDKFI